MLSVYGSSRDFIYVRFYLSALSTQWSVSVKDDTVAGEPHDNRISGTYFNILICYDFLFFSLYGYFSNYFSSFDRFLWD